MKVNGKNDIPYIMENKILFPNHQPVKNHQKLCPWMSVAHPVSDTPSTRLLRFFHGMTLGIAQESRHHRAHVPAERRIFMGFQGEKSSSLNMLDLEDI